MESFIALLLGFVIVILIVCLNEVFKGKYLNKGWAVKNPIQELDLSYLIQPPRFKIEKVERTRSCNDVCWVGKYTAECWYRTKRGADYSRIVFYEELNKYNVGDTLVLTPEIENN